MANIQLTQERCGFWTKEGGGAIAMQIINKFSDTQYTTVYWFIQSLIENWLISYDKSTIIEQCARFDGDNLSILLIESDRFENATQFCLLSCSRRRRFYQINARTHTRVAHTRVCVWIPTHFNANTNVNRFVRSKNDLQRIRQLFGLICIAVAAFGLIVIKPPTAAHLLFGTPYDFNNSINNNNRTS